MSHTTDPAPSPPSDRRHRTVHRRARCALAVAGLGAAVLATACQPVAPPAGTTTTTAIRNTVPVPASTWKLIGGDEFDGTAVDPARWRALHSTYGDGNLELACLTPANVSEGGGSLAITPRRQTATCPGGVTRQYTSGFLSSRDAGRYYPLELRVEMRARLPHAQGLWPALWLRHIDGASTAEIDIMEYFHAQVPGRTTQTLHLDGVANVAKATTGFEPPNQPAGWHTWAVEIVRVDADGDGIRDDVEFRFTTDGRETLRFTDVRHLWANSGDPQRTWDVAVNLAVGGRWVGRPDGALGVLEDLGRCAQAGTPPACQTTGINRVDWGSPASTTFAVDYVRLYQRTAT
jgi:beta-glucanase (GH16 family)